ncbi:host specificity factor TipJ family phage tail protein [uncultured Castellaniella sp.]|uniref:host specificity factor TipJ family phage tail protein n=1 Tax=uncultured Castellaniella sp. TaxID=647907 RepID=UPI002601709B|nr:host specificity factor TipJ family phage tail protein [uncultured Castellaniella sp.]
MTIDVYPSLLEGEPIERHEWAGTLGAWFDKHGIEWRGLDAQPVLASVNGAALPADAWDSRVLAVSDQVEIRVVPGGGIFKAIGSIFNFLFGWLMPGGADAGSYSTPQGRQLEASQAKANAAKLGDAVPELAGRFKRFPEYLTPPRRFFVNKREQWLQFHACVGPGRYAILASDVKVGDTPFSALGADGSYQFYVPGADLSAQTTAEHWHTAEEVGGTSSGTAGLELSTEFANRNNTDPPAYTLTASSITRSSGVFPSGWGAGTQVYVEYPRLYTITTQQEVKNPGPPIEYQNVSEFDGYFGHLGTLTVGMSVRIGTRASGAVYTVRSVVGSKVRFSNAAGDPVVVTPGPNQAVIFGADIVRTIGSVASETSITLSPGGFQSSAESNVRVAFAGGTVYGEWTSEFIATPGNELTTVLEADFFFPRGLARINDENGSLVSLSAAVEIQYRDARGGPSTTVRRTYTEATVDQIGFTERLTVPQMRPAVRVRRVGAGGTQTTIQDTIHWYGLKARIGGAPTRYPNWTTMAVKLRSGGRLAARSENQINVVATRMLPTLQPDGTWGPEVATSDISAFVRYIALSIGYTDDNLDMIELRRLHAIWTARGETADHVFDLTTVKEALGLVLRAGMSEMTISDGQIRAVRDDARTQFEQAYSPQNMTKPLQRQFKAHRHDDPDGVEVEYTDSETWTKQTVICSLPGSQRLKLEKLKLDGVTDRTRAWRIGMRKVRATKYRLWDYSFQTEMDALNSEYLSYVPLFDDVPGYGQSAILEGIESAAGGALLHISEPLRWDEGAAHVVAYRCPDGTIAGPWAATPGPDEYSLIADIPQPWPAVTLKHEPPHVYFGATEQWCFPALITEIKPSGTEKVSVSAVNYDVRVYADDNNAPTE